MKILILASNPRKDLNLDREIRDLKDVIQKSHNRQQFEVDDALAVRVSDLHDLLFKHRPQVVHFCGHGSGQQGLVFEGNDGGEHWVRTDALSDLFRLFSRNVGCVLLNACYSEEQASAIVNHIDYVIGMNREIRDDAAIAFSKGFYRALGYECSIEEAFEFGKNAIQLEISGGSKMRSGTTEQQRKLEVADAVATVVLPEHLKPILKRRPTLTQSNQVVSGSEPTLSQAKREEIQLDVAQALAEEEPSLKQFREQVREYLQDRKLAEYEQDLLEALREELGLSIEEAKRIIEEEQAPIRQAQQAYEKRLVALIKYYPFNPAIQAELKKFQNQRNLTDKEVDEISRPILEQAETDYQEKLRQREQQEHQIKLQRYEQEFRKAIAAQYPFDSFIRDGLRNFQRSLGLSDADVTRLEEPIVAPEEAAYQQQLEQQREQQQQRELAQQQELERQQQLEEQGRQEEAKHRPLVKGFEFQVPKVNIGTQTIEKPGFFGKKTETITTVNISYQRGQAEYFVEELGNGITLEMVAIAGGTFIMGSTESNNEQPQHRVTVQPFFMGKFAVTQAQYQATMGENPANFKGEQRPVESVSWHQAVEFCDRLSQKTGRQYRLPSEAEWEYACRAGTTTPFYCGETITTNLANYRGTDWKYEGTTYSGSYGAGLKGEFRQQTTNTGSFPPNAFGLYDMHGNVWEWCADHWHENYEGAPTDGSAWVTGGAGDRRRVRGGSWFNHPWNCRSAYRDYHDPDGQASDLGFRVVCGLA